MLGTVNVDGKALRMGYTTGTTATAAAVAAARRLVYGVVEASVEVRLPAGSTLSIDVQTVAVDQQTIKGIAIKDGGDDIDVTHGLAIEATVRLTSTGRIELLCGEGVGVVTKPGLSVEVGMPAINPTPRKMLMEHLLEFLGDCGGLEVCLSVPGGLEASKKTFNPKLGILGGISIIGTTGIVVPMSEEAFKSALAVELRQCVALGKRELVFVFGNYGFDYARTLGYGEHEIIRTSNFIGHMLDEARLLGIRKVVLIGNIGKLVKVTGGIFHTHSRVSDAKREIITANLAMMKAPFELLLKVEASNTTEEAVTHIREYRYEAVFKRLADRAKDRMLERTYGEMDVEVIMFSDKKTFLAKTFEGELR
ncbi:MULTISPECIES: cobalt-precorrin-5B (C(1))-methyltransferase CbiD [unclassified Fusibacter]|uniref:cobalt-precorrin-5B (C(1))-methyltransferase CbiD n=1 Tax=unclassified Fusibacter TaxID=2624464 RepID=UPI0010133650|nr:MULTISPECIES: cobalt-precorrin-5B (C(1))-methyltransferase CbiD [unclassified Fusibacter]MCK8060506.1 cobalt-precorrin-5B (C(1))-methyltransferase CbiD [Fusibacter sp. A2]NPE20205.1 cobalamin biosynthesis protein CbiD [Fusibacter sp. A1]RXV63414.1 cobalamin biosynthesis protein CbiD [Fusibacter sp. A1]